MPQCQQWLRIQSKMELILQPARTKLPDVPISLMRMRAHGPDATCSIGWTPRRNCSRNAISPGGMVLNTGFEINFQTIERESPNESPTCRNRKMKQIMKPSKTKAVKASEAPVFPQMLHRVRVRTDAEHAVPNTKPPKRDNTFSKSRDTREDRGERQMKTSHNPQTFSRGR
jgi:hypothetical protein